MLSSVSTDSEVTTKQSDIPNITAKKKKKKKKKKKWEGRGWRPLVGGGVGLQITACHHRHDVAIQNNCQVSCKKWSCGAATEHIRWPSISGQPKY